MGLSVGASPAGHWSGCHAVAWDFNAPEYGVLEIGELGATPSLPTWPTSPVPPLTPTDAYVPVPGAPFGAAALYGARPESALAAGAE